MGLYVEHRRGRWPELATSLTSRLEAAIMLVVVVVVVDGIHKLLLTYNVS